MTKLDSIIVGERRREDLGDIQALAESLDRFGLLHPIVIDWDNNLIAGGRRLAAATILGWEEIDTRQLGELSEAERREIELEENVRRKDLTPIELSKRLVAQAEQITPLLRSESEHNDTPPTTDSEVGAGRPGARTHQAPLRDIAQALGVSTGALVNAEQHVAAVDRYPELDTLPQSTAIDVAKVIDLLPPQEVAAVRERLAASDPAERRRLAREVAKSDAAESARILDLVGDPEGTIAREVLKGAISKGITSARRDLLRVNPADAVGLLDGTGLRNAQVFVSDARIWLDKFEAALSAGLRLVGESE